MYSATVSDGFGGIACGCACSPGKYGLSFILTTSGIFVCPCQEEGGSAFQIQLEDRPDSFTLNATSPTNWVSDLAGSAVLMIGTTCDFETEGQPGKFFAAAQCLDDGIIVVSVRWLADSLSPILDVYGAQFSGLNQAQPSLQIACNHSLPTHLWQGGMGTITAPVIP